MLTLSLLFLFLNSGHVSVLINSSWLVSPSATSTFYRHPLFDYDIDCGSKADGDRLLSVHINLSRKLMRA